MKTLPSTEQLLISGCDHRLQLDEQGFNQYQCRPQVEHDLLRFGSSTASNVSAPDFAIAEQFRVEFRAKQLAGDQHQTDDALCRHYSREVIQGIRSVCQLESSTSVVLAESGTIAHQQLMILLSNKYPGAAWHIVMVAASETGRGVAQALASTPCSVSFEYIAIRSSHAQALPQEDIEAAFSYAIQQAVQANKHVLVIAIDQSKTGMVTPPLANILSLRDQRPQQIHVLLDACQCRLSRDSLNAYLNRHMMVAITGSKFFAAPSFASALLLPDGQFQEHIEASPCASIGLLMRWHIALISWQNFQQLRTSDIGDLLQLFAQSMHAHYQQTPALMPLDAPAIQRPWSQNDEWDTMPTIFPFVLQHIDYEKALVIYKDLQQRPTHKVQLGYPIALPRGQIQKPQVQDTLSQDMGTQTASAVFRLSLSAPMITQAIQQGSQKKLIQDAIKTLQWIVSCR